MSLMTHHDVDIPVISLTEPMPGLGSITRFYLEALDEVGAMYGMRTDAEPGRVLLLAAAPVFHPDYTPVLDDATAAELGINAPEDAAIFLVVNAAESLAESTVNLVAPLIINVHTGAARQVVMTGSDHDMRAPLLGPTA